MKTQINQAEKLLKIIEEKDRQLAELVDQNRWLMEQFKLLKQGKFGKSREAVDNADKNQLNLFNEAEVSANILAPEPELTEVKAHYRKRTRLTTDKLPPDLPVEIIEHEIPKEERSCRECGTELHAMGKDIREELKIIPAKAIIVRHIRYTYACRSCEANSTSTTIVKANMPEPVIKGGFASAEAIAHIAVQKYMMASPLYRQEDEWKQSGILLSRQTMSNWLIKASEDWLSAVYEEMRKSLLRHKILHADETTLRVLKEPGKTSGTKCYMWLYRTSGEAESQIILYDYQRDRKALHAEEFLKGFKGYLHTDGYEGYHKLSGDIRIVGCLAHLRRKFFDAMKTLPKDKQKTSNAAKGVAYCDELFRLERQFADLSHDDRLAVRRTQSEPVFLEFYKWAESLPALPKSLLGQAVGYAFSQKEYLKRYLEDGRLEISNNRAERSIKPFVIGRKNWLFSNTPGGATASAIYYSLIVTAKENGLNPFEYLRWVLDNMPNLGKPGYVDKVADLLPGSVAIPKVICSSNHDKKGEEKFPWEEE
ncbi:MAG: IS66 family transposase [Bacteroidales bacterium]|jgi:transposase|nr:IS66 family transposase [Bacteroidales bacterium]